MNEGLNINQYRFSSRIEVSKEMLVRFADVEVFKKSTTARLIHALSEGLYKKAQITTTETHNGREFTAMVYILSLDEMTSLLWNTREKAIEECMGILTQWKGEK